MEETKEKNVALNDEELKEAAGGYNPYPHLPLERVFADCPRCGGSVYFRLIDEVNPDHTKTYYRYQCPRCNGLAEFYTPKFQQMYGKGGEKATPVFRV